MTNPIYSLAIFCAVVFMAIIAGQLLAEKRNGDRKNEANLSFGKQFEDSDLSNTSGVVRHVKVICDKTEIIVPDLIADNFIATKITEFTDVKGDLFRVAFWMRESTTGNVHIITQSHVGNNMTCILSVSKNINNSTDSEMGNKNDRKPAVFSSEEHVT